MLSFTVQAVPPATRDLNAFYFAKWNDETNFLGESYVCGLNGWYEHRSGIERDEQDGRVTLYTSTSLYKYKTGDFVRIDVGCIKGHSFIYKAIYVLYRIIMAEFIRNGRCRTYLFPHHSEITGDV